jgi:hypothetical protein
VLGSVQARVGAADHAAGGEATPAARRAARLRSSARPLMLTRARREPSPRQRPRLARRRRAAAAHARCSRQRAARSRGGRRAGGSRTVSGLSSWRPWWRPLIRSTTTSSGTSTRITVVGCRPRACSAPASTSAWATVRGKPSSTIGLSSKLAIASWIIATINESGTRSPRSMYFEARRPSSVPATRSSRSRSPVASAANPSSRRRAAWVPLPLPGGPSSAIVSSIAESFRAAAHRDRQARCPAWPRGLDQRSSTALHSSRSAALPARTSAQADGLVERQPVIGNRKRQQRPALERRPRPTSATAPHRVHGRSRGRADRPPGTDRRSSPSFARFRRRAAFGAVRKDTPMDARVQRPAAYRAEQ